MSFTPYPGRIDDLSLKGASMEVRIPHSILVFALLAIENKVQFLKMTSERKVH